MAVQVVRRQLVVVLLLLVGVHRRRVVRVLEIDVARDVAVVVLVAHQAGHRFARRRAGSAAATVSAARFRLVAAVVRALLAVLLHSLVLRSTILEPDLHLSIAFQPTNIIHHSRFYSINSLDGGDADFKQKTM